MRFGDVTVDLADRRVTLTASGTVQVIRLTPTEWAILELLVRNSNRLVTLRTVLDEVWGSRHAGDTGYLRLYVSQLPKKLERVPSQPEHLLTEAGIGYRFVP